MCSFFLVFQCLAGHYYRIRQSQYIYSGLPELYRYYYPNQLVLIARLYYYLWWMWNLGTYLVLGASWCFWYPRYLWE